MRVVPIVAAIAATAALAGCTGLSVAGERRGTVASPRALELAWSTPATQPDWLPADASDIRYAIATTGGADAAPAAIRAATRTALPDSCRAESAAMPAAIDASWAPGTPSSVVRCGNWFVARTADGYYGWTPATLHG